LGHTGWKLKINSFLFTTTTYHNCDSRFCCVLLW
jgi:hypothetical protein